MTEKEFREAALKLLRNSHIIDIATVTEEGYPRPVAVAQSRVDDGFQIWFATNSDSNKVRHIRKNPKAGVSAWEGSDSVSLVGELSIESAENKAKYWVEWFNHHYKNPTDPKYCLLRFTPKKANLYINHTLREIDF